jgi:spore maturation protein A
MINIVWFFLMSVSILVAAGTGKTALISNSIFTSTGKAVEFTIGLAGIIAFWSGILKIAETSGVTEAIAKIFQPLLSKLFPKIPKGHQALGLISMTVAANLFGLGNIATPLGLKTMAELKTLSTDPDNASNATCSFMALVFGGLSIIPTTLIAIRARAGSSNPALIIAPVFILSLIGTLMSLFINYLALKLANKESMLNKKGNSN